VRWDGKKTGDNTEFGEFGVGYDLIETLGIAVKEGRSSPGTLVWTAPLSSSTKQPLRPWGLHDPVGKTITYGADVKQIVGVVNNFHLESLYER
jgi:hypothetical protein